MQLETGADLARFTNNHSDSDNQAIPADVRLIIQELQSSRQKERELRALVDALQAEQTLAKERLALYSVLSLKLKRELINERLAHIDSKKETVEARNKHQQQLDAGDDGPTGSTRRSSQDHHTEEDDPWSSPGKAPGSAATAGSNLLSFTSFYHSARAASEDEPPSPVFSTSGGGLQPLRNSLMGQFLPSSLLDSPQSTSSQGRSAFSRKDNDNASARLTFEAEIKQGLDAFTLSEPPCTQCKQNPVSECTPCGHRLCASCEASMLARSHNDNLTCPRCKTKVSSVKAFHNRPSQEDNQVDHFLEGDLAASSASSASKRQSGISSPDAANVGSAVVSPITLSLLAELFDAIPVEQLEMALKESGGQASLAIEKILHTHPSFNPGASGGGSASQSPIGPGHKAALLHRSTSANAATNQERTGGAGGGQSSASSNWKTEMCMYYLQGKCNKTRRTCSFAHGESDLVRTNTSSTSSKHTPNAAYKARMCPLYLEGLCPKSRRDCPLAHGESDLRDGLAAVMTLSASSSLPAAAPRLQSYKTELCYYYLKGCCNYTKDECRFAHGEGDLRTVESNTMEWSQKLGGGGGGDYPSGPGSVSSVGSAPSGGASLPGLSLDKQLQHQHQYQQQFQPQQPPQQPPQAPSGQQQLQHGSPAFPPPPHQLAGLQHTLPHQFSPYQHHHQQPQHQQHMPPPHLPLHHHQQQSMYHGNSPAQTHQFRYLKSMEDAVKQGARPPPQPRRDAPSWSGYEPSSGGDF